MKHVLLAIVLAALSPSLGRAQSARDIVVAYNTGWRFSIAPGLLISDGEVGFSIAGDVRYGFEVGPLILAPGARVAGYFPPGFWALTGLATGRITYPLGPVGPYLVGGIGPGYLSEPAQAGAAYLGGGGLMIHVGTSFAFGAELTYFGITGTDFRAFGPSLLLMF
ncbi:MAG TPA: hypothetical protein VFX59_09955 [Polyangiales bacterium]|nr:hypothetical protein [Polyangiales bacterium]